MSKKNQKNILQNIISFFKSRNGKIVMGTFVFWVILYPLNKFGLMNNYWMHVVNVSLIFVILTVSLNLINGFTGQFSIGHMGFAAIGAYTSATLTTLIWKLPSHGTVAYLAFIGALLLGGIAAAFIGFLIGLPTLRLRGDYLAIVTLAFGEIIRVTINSISFVGGPRGIPGIPRFSTFTFVLIATVLSVIIMRNIIYSSIGRAFLSIREDEVASELVGVDTTRYKVIGFTIGAFFAGIGGGLLAHLVQYINPLQFGFMATIYVLIMVYVGGIGSISGSIVAAIGLTFLSEGLRFGLDKLNSVTTFPVGPEWRMVIYAVLLIATMLYKTNGLMGGIEFNVLIPEEEDENAKHGA